MLSLGMLFVGIILAFLIGWLISEIRAKEPVRIVLGLSAIVATTFFVSSLVCYFTLMSYNQEFGYSTEDLIKTSEEQIEEGHLERVLKAWHGLREQYHPSYETQRPAYSDLVNEATKRMRAESEDEN